MAGDPGGDLRIAGTVDDSIVDGPGFRLAVFVQGCSHRCPGCQNPDTHDPAGGTSMQPDDIIEMMRENPLLDGVTLTGGEPFEQPAPLALIADAAHGLSLTVWAYSGSTYDELAASEDEEVRELLKRVDVLVDGPFVEALGSLDLDWRGSANQRIIDVPASLAAGEPVLWEGR